MTVEQLIAVLQKMPQDGKVMVGIYEPSFCERHNAEKVEVMTDNEVEISWTY